MSSLPELLTDDQLAAALETLPDWEVKDGRLHRSFAFRDFSEATGFMVRVALIAERLGHHPAWSGVYASIALSLDTHEVGGITSLDVGFANEVSGLIT